MIELYETLLRQDLVECAVTDQCFNVIFDFLQRQARSRFAVVQNHVIQCFGVIVECNQTLLTSEILI